MIKRYNLFYFKSRRIYHNPDHKHPQAKLRYKNKARRSPKPKGLGYLEIDTIVKFIHKIKLYVLNAFYVNLKFPFFCGYLRLNSENRLDFVKKT